MTKAEGVINPHTQAPYGCGDMVRSIWINRQLLRQLTVREIASRYKGSILGLAWSLIQPLLMLGVYTFAFSVVFNARWGLADETRTQFAVILFVGLITHGLLAEMFIRAPLLIIANANYVKKVVFPLELLPVVALGSALFHSCISLLVLLAAVFLIVGSLHWTIFLVPIVFAPFIVLLLGATWLLASLGVYLRDISQITNILITVLMFLSPVFYPLKAVPQSLQPIILANPLTFIIEQARAVLLFGQLPNWTGLGVYMVTAILCAWIGFAWFQKTRKGFADVI